MARERAATAPEKFQSVYVHPLGLGEGLRRQEPVPSMEAEALSSAFAVDLSSLCYIIPDSRNWPRRRDQ